MFCSISVFGLIFSVGFTLGGLILMSCFGGKGAFFKLSRIFVKIHTWVLVTMSLNCKLSGLNGRLSANFKVKKAKKSVLEPNCLRKWTRKLVFFWLFGFVAIGSFWFFFLSFNNRILEEKMKILGSCQENTPISQKYFNVSKNQLHALASFFSKSDQDWARNHSRDPEVEAALK